MHHLTSIPFVCLKQACFGMSATTYAGRIIKNALGSIIYHIFVIVPGQG